MIRLLLVFIIIYVSFSAILVNYAKAFRVKNQIIDYLEQNEVEDIATFFQKEENKISESQKISKIDNILTNANYINECNNGNGIIDNGDGEKNGYCYNGIVITPTKSDNNNEIIYQVSTYANWNLGILNVLLSLGGENPDSKSPVTGTWKITGEAKIRIR